MSVFPLAHPSIRFHHFAPSNHRTTSAHRYPTCPSLLRYHHFNPSHYTSPSLSHLPVRYHHLDSSHYTSPSLSCSRLPVLRPDPSTGCTFWNVITLFDLLRRPVVNIMASSARALIARLSSKSMALLIRLGEFSSLIHLLYL